ncbi:YbhB/YbcL family Raf kinase inhibitor-like protein [Clostridium estertheticum]|uniref:YbhB/YbcL family Raf kinase inhibitor-like protein n=1 Tax=Clostridium estertheticum TaxID=238834 RepID=UPI001C6F51B6|nr:YbhB/YbcL family Raf kinase inhibitor-like protein [Clostridium estertheticum]MBW9173449.1 YbhB/YbcL family Raf kinase inhibitor-like protein [Clostridium estertheticum]WLC77571.1 YbhB/YbcL family Raf kinase inhibitor-like protein [Clostridium estertheticum]
MKINVTTENGYLPAKYSKFAEEKYQYKGSPCISFPIYFIDISGKVKSIAITFLDYDAIPLCGFTWIHWLVCNIPANIDCLPENISVDNSLNVVQGQNSFASPYVGETDSNITNRYAGPTPPDKEHEYTLKVYGLDKKLDLKQGYFMNDFYKAINGHVVESDELKILAHS